MIDESICTWLDVVDHWKKDASSAKRLQFKNIPFDKLLMQIKSNDGPKIELWGTPALTFSQNECYPFRVTCYLCGI